MDVRSDAPGGGFPIAFLTWANIQGQEEQGLRRGDP
jgi:hemolysin-activating ACP:hemolysin acyltransferase